MHSISCVVSTPHWRAIVLLVGTNKLCGSGISEKHQCRWSSNTSNPMIIMSIPMSFQNANHSIPIILLDYSEKCVRQWKDYWYF